ncbi:hypothetical protein EVJ50_12800 [Synechococcus sp. RSCCF101]|uniref:hypothetical protein n=1 Tax=Synechococcus sp. RSCCF101 TaxID=2511069 RepID=UPI001247A6AE|nr:hypothetical protein [Synechococcus sp. RSCCF101]QEY32975.1 hypothetical protein EVJ50_12800 [Synechococcus sp. RSCCF101]
MPASDSGASAGGGPLDAASVQRLDATLLPAVQRHALRVLAHSLATFQQMADSESAGTLPDDGRRLEWCRNQPVLREDPAFTRQFLDQLAVAGRQLERLADQRGLQPLELSLDVLIEDAETTARALIEAPEPPP